MQSKGIVVSVACITYNHAPYIRQCLEGFLMQKTNFPIEIIVHDDASTDGTDDIIREYALKYPELFKVILQEENQYSKGVDVLSLVFERSAGKYIALCEGDDYWTDPLKLQKQVDFLEEHEEFSMCFHRAAIVQEINGPIWLSASQLEAREYSAEELFSTWLVPTASILYRRQVNDIPIKYSSDIMNGDIVLVLKCCSMGRVMALEDEMSVYRMHAGGVTYSPIFSKERLRRYPKHFISIKRNFQGLLNKKLLNRRISNSYWDLREVPSSRLVGLIYKLLAFYYAPIFILNKYRKIDIIK